MLLGKVQELDIVRAGTIGNVRIIDRAAVNLSEPVKPRKTHGYCIDYVTGVRVGECVCFFKAG